MSKSDVCGYSAFGEDLWILENYPQLPNGVIVDVGASDGIRGSNSLLFEMGGVRSICIEPDPRSFGRLRYNRKECYSIGISDRPGRQSFFLHPSRPTHSSLVPYEEVLYQKVEVETQRLDTFVQKLDLSAIAILDIDVEGHELAVWRSLNLYIRPALIIIEYADSRPNCAYTEVERTLRSDAYTLVHQTPANLIFETSI